MKQSELLPIKLEYTPQFKKRLKALGKRYRAIRQDLEPLLNELLDRGVPGDRIKGLKQRVYKVRLPNSDANRGKSGGYRVIYYTATSTDVWLLLIYSKFDQPDVSSAELRAILRELPTS